jgi:sigma-E factor negative regulatory protein RseB
MKPAILYFLAAMATLLQVPVSADSSGREWLERMSAAAQSLNYTGTFVYQRQGLMDVMQIVHVSDEEGERERLFSLTGPKREVLRDNQAVTCIMDDQHSVLVSKARPRATLPAGFPSELSELEQHYSFKVGGEDRVAGLDCRQVEVKPRDRFRYGRTLCVHEDTYLLLRSKLIDGDGVPIEQVLFTSVDFPDSIPEKELLPGLSGAGFTWKREPEHRDQPRDSAWKVLQVPPGFMLTDHRWHRLSEHQEGVEHWMYSDGLASVSVYIEKSGQEDDYSGVASRGGLNAYGTMTDGYHVTVVGEVPLQTVELIARSVSAR